MELIAHSTSEQVRLMKHAIGFNQKKVKRGKYTAWRNYFFSYSKIFEWENLVDNGLAVKREDGNGIYYHVSEKGLQFLGDILSIQIIEDD